MNKRDSREHSGREEFEERDDAGASDVEDADDPLQKVDQLLAVATDQDLARPLLYQLRRQLMEREISFQEARRSLVEMEAALEKAGFRVTRRQMTATSFYFSRILECERV